jgi:rare lipoprotein A (peptidoglycan hydrolase)
MFAETTNIGFINIDCLRSPRYRQRARRYGIFLLKGAVLSLLFHTGIARAADHQPHIVSKEHQPHGRSDASRHTRRQSAGGHPTARRYALIRRIQQPPRRIETNNFVQNVATQIPVASHTTDADPPRDQQAEQPATRGEILAKGVASWYSADRYNKLTASGSRFDENAMTAAHPWLPLGTRVRVTLEGTAESVVVTINDRLGLRSRVIDLSKGAARELGILSRGLARVILTRS